MKTSNIVGKVFESVSYYILRDFGYNFKYVYVTIIKYWVFESGTSNSKL